MARKRRGTGRSGGKSKTDGRAGGLSGKSESNGRSGRRRGSPLPFSGVSEATAGMPPGTPVYVGDREPTVATYSTYCYDEKSAELIIPRDVEELLRKIDPAKVNWINVNGLSGGAPEKICAGLGVHPLVVEDILNTEHRPKLESYGDCLFLITKMLILHDDGEIEYEQVSFLLKGRTLVSFQERPGDCFTPVRERIIAGAGRVRSMGADYLLYRLLDVIVDNYFVVLEHVGDRLEGFDFTNEENEYDRDFVVGLQELKRELAKMRRIVWPVRESVGALARTDGGFVDPALAPYLRDLYENTVQAIEALESYREHAAEILELHLSAINNRLSQIMKLLTILSAIFIPITFIAGVYGMNFRHMPELDKPWAYPAVLGVMATVVIGELIYFKRKKWI
ncbi:MAG: magnesium/cobalt transporter CorA [Rectinemataceae bacterium]